VLIQQFDTLAFFRLIPSIGNNCKHVCLLTAQFVPFHTKFVDVVVAFEKISQLDWMRSDVDVENCGHFVMMMMNFVD